MLPAEKKHYRQGLALGLTLAETFSIIVFVLLLASAILLRDIIESREEAQDERDHERAEKIIAQSMLSQGELSWADADAWFEEARRLRQERDSALRLAEEAAAEAVTAKAGAEELRVMLEATEPASSGADAERRQELAERVVQLQDSVAAAEERARREETRADSIETRVGAIAPIAEAVAEIAEAAKISPEDAEEVLGRIGRAEQVARQLDSAHRAIVVLDERLLAAEAELATSGDSSLRSARDSLRAAVNTLEDRVVQAEQRRDDAARRSEMLQDELDQLGTGIDPSPCWLDANRNPEYMFRVELTDSGMRVFGISPQYRLADPAISHAQRLVEGREYTPSEFQRLTRPIYDLGVARTDTFGRLGCRFWVEPVDATGASKAIFQERESQLARYFWFRWH